MGAPRAPHKEIREIIRIAEDAGFHMDRYTGTGHYKMRHGGGGTIIIPSTPSGRRWKQNVLADIRRYSKRKDNR